MGNLLAWTIQLMRPTPYLWFADPRTIRRYGMVNRAILRSPSASTIPSPNAIVPPPLGWLSGSWIITHTTLTALVKSQSATITYTPVPNTGKITKESIRNVQYGTYLAESVTSVSRSNITTIKRVSKPFAIAGGVKGEEAPDLCGDTYNWGERAALVYRWRRHDCGLMASRTWEILGYDDDPRSPESPNPKSNSWIVVYSGGTLFLPAELSIYCRNGKVRLETLQNIFQALRDMGGGMAKLVDGLHEFAPQDDNSKG
ncbi:hypothetical protein E8E13_011300 [Curvularia kusanoi]|uniref:Uncharacterized protein n=1 Tax=Curvularia kusanoi TaxID=90978 RepID=A0A9P4TKX3_CURKU|nr:hypothetical protein E8E13_011300 [Curvularia kusanoi]